MANVPHGGVLKDLLERDAPKVFFFSPFSILFP